LKPKVSKKDISDEEDLDDEQSEEDVKPKEIEQTIEPVEEDPEIKKRAKNVRLATSNSFRLRSSRSISIKQVFLLLFK